MSIQIICSIGKIIGFGMIFYSITEMGKTVFTKPEIRPEREQGTILSPRRRRQ